MSKKTIPVRPIVIGVLVLGAAAGGAYFFLRDANSETSHDSGSPGGGHETTYQSEGIAVQFVNPLAEGVAREADQPGVVHPFEWIDVYSKVPGYFSLDKPPLDIGDRVKKGDVIADIYSPELEKEVDQRKASLDQSKAVVKEMKAHILAAKASLDAAEAAVQQAVAETERDVSLLTLRQKEYKRFQDLYAQRSIDEQLVDEKKDAYDSAIAAVDASRANEHTQEANVAVAKANIERATADLATAEAKVEVAEADLARAQVFLDYTHFKAPFDGVITLRNVHSGDFIQVGVQTDHGPIYRLARTDLMRVVVEVPDRIAPFVDPGDTAQVYLDSLPGEVFKAPVSRISYAEDNKTRTMRVEIDLENKDGRLRSGMFGRTTILAREPSPDAVRIPSSCLVGKVDGGVGSVYLVEDNKAKRREVVVGYDNGDVAEIVKGLATTDRVITRNSSVQDGIAVNATKAEE